MLHFNIIGINSCIVVMSYMFETPEEMKPLTYMVLILYELVWSIYLIYSLLCQRLVCILHRKFCSYLSHNYLQEVILGEISIWQI